jgi:hypothetical protein
VAHRARGSVQTVCTLSVSQRCRGARALQCCSRWPGSRRCRRARRRARRGRRPGPCGAGSARGAAAGNARRRPLERGATQLVAGRLEAPGDACQLRAAGRVGYRLPEPRQPLGVEPMAAGPDAEDLRGEPSEEAAHGAAALALPEPKVDVVLVRTGVAGEAGISVDAEDRAQHPGLGPDPRGELDQLLPGGDHERLGRRDPEHLVFAPVGVEPVLVVVTTQLAQEPGGLWRETAERARRPSWCPTWPPPSSTRGPQRRVAGAEVPPNRV